MRRKRKQLPVHRNDGTSSVAASSNGTNSSSQATVATARRCLIKYSLSYSLLLYLFSICNTFSAPQAGPFTREGAGCVSFIVQELNLCLFCVIFVA